MRSPYNVFILSGIFILTRTNFGGCNPITISNFDEHIREFSLKQDNTVSNMQNCLNTVLYFYIYIEY